MSRDTRILIDEHDDWVTKGRYSLFDNTTGAFFIVRVHELKLEDSGTYVCGVDVPNQQDHISMIQLKVTRGTVYHKYHHSQPTQWILSFLQDDGKLSRTCQIYPIILSLYVHLMMTNYT